MKRDKRREPLQVVRAVVRDMSKNRELQYLRIQTDKRRELLRMWEERKREKQ